MAMEDPRVLLHMNMNFNPFRSSHSTPNSSSPPPRPVVEAPQQRILNDPDNDSWHSNAPNRSIIDNDNNDNSPASSSHHHHHHHGSRNKPPASALSWFSSWTTPTTPTTTTTTTLRTATASSSSAIIIQEGQHTNSKSVSVPQHHHLPPLSPPPLSPAKSMTMKRGMSSESHEVHESNGSSHNHKLKSPLGGHSKLLGVKGGEGGCVPTTIHQNGSSSNGISSPIRSTSCVIDESQMDDALGLPPYPASPTKAPRTQMIHATPRRTNKPLLQEFPMSGNTSAAAALPPYEVPTKAPRAQVIHATPRTNKPLLQEFPMSRNAAASRIANKKKITSKSNNSQSFSKCKQLLLAKEEDSTFPGFALFQLAKAYYCMGQLSQALDTTTECLAFQKISLSGNYYEGNTSSASAAAAAAMAKGGGGTAVASSPKLESIRKGSIDSNDTNNSVMTPLDLRSSFVPTVLGVVQSLKGSESSNNPMNGQQQQPTHHHPHHHHPMLSNSIAIMIAQYPTHACVAQTLFLRGRFLAECGMTDNDYSLLQQAIQHAEMAVAIQRKLLLSSSMSNEELAPPLIFLANMKTKLGHFNEADMSYKEAVSILKDARSCTRRYHHVDAMENNGQDAKEVASSDYAKHHFKRLTGEFANALYLHGKAYHCQRMHAQAFGCYNKALNLLRKAGGGVSSRDNKLSVKRIVRCMKNRYALEKLVSAYWDDPGTI